MFHSTTMSGAATVNKSAAEDNEVLDGDNFMAHAREMQANDGDVLVADDGTSSWEKDDNISMQSSESEERVTSCLIAFNRGDWQRVYTIIKESPSFSPDKPLFHATPVVRGALQTEGGVELEETMLSRQASQPKRQPVSPYYLGRRESPLQFKGESLPPAACGVC